MSASAVLTAEACVACWGDLTNPPAGWDHNDFPTLPEGYTYTSFVGSIALGRLLRRHYRVRGCDWLNVETDNRSSIRRGLSLADVGIVHDEQGRLVGFGRLRYRQEQGELTDLVVHSQHRGIKLGSAIIDARLILAEQLGVDSLYIPSLEDTNPALNHYLDKGFSRTWGGELLLGPDPAPLTPPIITGR